MDIDLKRCAVEPVHIEGKFEVAERFAGYAELECLTEIQAVIDARAAGERKFMVAGDIQASPSAYCARCLESFELAVHRRFEIMYVPTPVTIDGEPVEPDNDDTSYYRDDRIEVLPLLEEQVNLSFPMRFLCAETCRGLCPQCGQNRNQASCSCAGNANDEVRDQPFRALGSVPD